MGWKELMFRIRFYEDKRGRSQAYEYIASLKKKGSKDARIKLAKIATYLNVLQEKGTWTGEESVQRRICAVSQKDVKL